MPSSGDDAFSPPDHPPSDIVDPQIQTRTTPAPIPLHRFPLVLAPRTRTREALSGQAVSQSQTMNSLTRRLSRQTVFCHQCENEWYRQELGLICPSCSSEFVEVVEPGNDPRVADNDTDNMPALVPRQPFMGMPQAVPSHHIAYGASPGGGYSISGTFYSPGPRAASQPDQRHETQDVTTNFMQMLASLVPQQPQHPAPRYHYTPGVDLSPRDPNTQQPNGQQVDELPNVLSALLQNYQNPRQHHVQVEGANPVANLMGLIFGPGLVTGNMGDYAFNQDDFDHAISELMDQNQMGHAPPPAESRDIAQLPKVPVTTAMLGENGKADCSVCMDSVELGQLVTKLYCEHWFHEQCISMWLKEHNTCPHCRKSIAEGMELAVEKGTLVPETPTSGLPSSCSVAVPTAPAPQSFHRETRSNGAVDDRNQSRVRSPDSQNADNNNSGGFGNFRRSLASFFHHNNNDSNNNGGGRQDSR